MTSGYHMLTERDRSAMRRNAQADEAGARLDAIKAAESAALAGIIVAIHGYARVVNAQREYADAIPLNAIERAIGAAHDELRDLSFKIREDLVDMECGFGRYSEEG